MASVCTPATCGYVVVINGHLSDSIARWFEGLKVIGMPDGNTLIVGNDLDQAALFGLLIRIRDLGIRLVLVAYSDLPDDAVCHFLKTAIEQTTDCKRKGENDEHPVQ